MARQASALVSLGAPIGALAIIAGCSGGGSVVGTVAKAVPTSPGHPVAPGPMVPVTILINPPKRGAASRRRILSLPTLRTFSGFIKIGVTAFVGTVTPFPAPTEMVTTFPAPSQSSGPSPFPISVNVPLSSGDTFIVNEYDAALIGPSYPNGYLLSTYTSATPIPVYQNATNQIAITTVPVVSNVNFGATTHVSFFENQATTQMSSIPINLMDAENLPIVGVVANPPVLSSTIPGLFPLGGLPVPQTTTLPLTAPANLKQQSGFVTTTFPSVPFNSPASSTLNLYADWFFLLGDSGNTISSYDAVNAQYFGLPAALSSISVSSTGPPTRIVGAHPGCGGYLAQAIIGSKTGGGNLATVVGILTSAGTLTKQTSPVLYADVDGAVLNPGSCTGYVLSSDDSSNAYLYQVTMATGGAVQFPLQPNHFMVPAGLGIDATGTTLFTGDSTVGYLYGYQISPPSPSPGNGYAAGSMNDLLAANGHIFQSRTSGYLNAYPNVTSTPSASIALGASTTSLIASPDGLAVFAARGNAISYINNSGAIAASPQSTTTVPSGSVTAMVVSSDGKTLYVADALAGTLYKYDISSITSSGFGAASIAFAIPTTTTSIGISP